MKNTKKWLENQQDHNETEVLAEDNRMIPAHFQFLFMQDCTILEISHSCHTISSLH